MAILDGLQLFIKRDIKIVSRETCKYKRAKKKLLASNCTGFTPFQ